VPVPTEIATPRLTLGRVDPRFAEDALRAVDASHAELDPWMAWAPESTLETALEFVRACEEGWERGTEFQFYIFLDDVPVGSMGLNRVNPMQGHCEIGYWIRSDVAGRGLTTEAASAVVSFAFDDVRLHRAELHAGLDNVGSIRVAEKLGFQREGILRHGSRGSGGWYDVIVFGLLESDERPAFHRA
jgi:ribosomal-protein-serine acetyltransferase